MYLTKGTKNYLRKQIMTLLCNDIFCKKDDGKIEDLPNLTMDFKISKLNSPLVNTFIWIKMIPIKSELEISTALRKNPIAKTTPELWEDLP